jgi:hypothetical protein
MFHARAIHRIAPRGAPGEDAKPGRPYLLLHDRHAEAEAATFAYGTRQPTLLRGGGECVHVDGGAADGSGMGLTGATYFCPCRLFPVAPGAIREKLGELAPEEMDRVRESLRRSLGIGKGSNRGLAAGSWRGAFVRLAPAVRAATGAAFALVVTEPEYSKRRWFQHLIPLLGPETEPGPGYLEVVEPWLSTLHGTTRGYLAVPLIFSGSETGRPAWPGHFSQVMATVADEDTLARVDASLIELFRLP